MQNVQKGDVDCHRHHLHLQLHCSHRNCLVVNLLWLLCQRKTMFKIYWTILESKWFPFSFMLTKLWITVKWKFKHCNTHFCNSIKCNQVFFINHGQKKCRKLHIFWYLLKQKRWQKQEQTVLPHMIRAMVAEIP